jgi:hypothetical protein
MADRLSLHHVQGMAERAQQLGEPYLLLTPGIAA